MTAPKPYAPYDFANRRHIGPSPEEMAEMLDVVGTDTLDTLIGETIPANIRQQTALSFGKPLSERGVLDRMRRSAGRR